MIVPVRVASSLSTEQDDHSGTLYTITMKKCAREFPLAPNEALSSKEFTRDSPVENLRLRAELDRLLLPLCRRSCTRQRDIRSTAAIAHSDALHTSAGDDDKNV